MIDRPDTGWAGPDEDSGYDPDADSGGGVATATITFDVESVTGGRPHTATFQSELEAGAAARAIASELALPDNVPWTLRSNRSSAFLDDRKPLGEQIRPGERVTVTPKAHLGARAG